MLRSWSRSALALAGIGLALYALGVALTGTVYLGWVHDEAATVVLKVSPDTFGWESGLRPEQTIERLRPGDEPGGWAVQTAEANGGELVLLGPVELFLRASALLALVGLGFGVLALPVARLPPRRAELLAVLGICLSTVPVALAYERTVGLVVIGAAAIGPWTWFTRWGGVGRRVALGGLAASTVLWAGWLVLRIAEPVAGVALRNVLGAAIAISVLLLVVAGARMTLRQLAAAVATTRLVDVAVMAAAIVVAIGLFALGISPLLAAAVVALPLILFVATRRQVADGLERALLADLRERESIRATEEERARVSREIHDDPLQQIAGVIHRLEGADPDPAAATASLRDVAAKLRGVATELHPPVLDDLGLVPAIEGAARGVTAPPVEVAVVNEAGYGPARRPPPDVELAAFRIVGEAIANAVRHAAATRIRVSGEVAPDAIDLAVADDGRGLADEAVEAAQREGHMGLASMRARAASIGAGLDIGRGPDGGTVVSLRWRR